MDSVNKRQFGILVFMVPLVFKVVTLPRLLASVAGADCYISMAVMALLECVMLAVIVVVHRAGGMAQFKKVVGNTAYRLALFPLLAVFMLKSIVYMAEATDYIANAMFYNITNYKVLIMLAIVVLFVATKGFRGSARTVEILVWIFVIIALVGLCFGKMELKFGALLPICADGLEPIAKSVYQYSFWMLDLTPLLFVRCSDISKKKPYLLVGGGGMLVFSVVVYVAFVANYGGSAPYISNAFARLATFNMVNTEIGSIDWPSIVLWMSMAIIAVALNVVASGKVIADNKKLGNFSLVAFVVVASLIAGIWLKNNQQVINFATSWVKYVVVALQIVVPTYILICIKLHKGDRHEKVA